jgi:hypothetical protein
VLADGSIVHANKDNKSDLWKALKGGSGNLGFVTRIDQCMEALPILFDALLAYILTSRVE